MARSKDKKLFPSFQEYTDMSAEDKAAIPRSVELLMQNDPQFLKDQQAAQHAEAADNAQIEKDTRAEIVAAG